MATKDKDTTPEVTQSDTPEVTPEVVVDLNALVRIKLTKARGQKGKGKFVRVNDHRYFIPYGEGVEVPQFIAMVIENSMAQDEQTERLIEQKTAEGSSF